jgi:hypothetical protein
MFLTREAGVSIKPGVERSGTPGSVGESIQARGVGGSRIITIGFVKIATAIARFAGSLVVGDSILGLTPQAGVPSRASRLGWKSLCCRALRALF